MCLAHRHGLFAPGESLAENDTLAVQQTLLFPVLYLILQNHRLKPRRQDTQISRWYLSSGLRRGDVPPGLQSLQRQWLISEGRHSDAVADKIILKIASEKLWRSLCCHSYSSGLQKHLNNGNKHDIKTKTGLLAV